MSFCPETGRKRGVPRIVCDLHRVYTIRFFFSSLRFLLSPLALASPSSSSRSLSVCPLWSTRFKGSHRYLSLQTPLSNQNHQNFNASQTLFKRRSVSPKWNTRELPTMRQEPSTRLDFGFRRQRTVKAVTLLL